MRERLSFLLVVFGVLFLAGCADMPRASSDSDSAVVYQAHFDPNVKPQMTYAQAVEKLKSAYKNQFYNTVDGKSDYTQVIVRRNEFGWKDYMLHKYDKIQELEVTQEPFWDKILFKIEFNSNVAFYDGRPSSPVALAWLSLSDARDIVDAVMALKYYDSDEYLAQQEQKFQEKANAWRSLPQKSPLPEEARNFRVLADDALANKNFEKAAEYYEKGLAIEPMWPKGQYNLAIIYEALKDYDLAVEHMKHYLALVPDASDAQLAHDKIVVWDQKSKEGQ